MTPAIPLADVADDWLRDLTRMTGSAALAALDGPTLLGERAMLRGLRIGGRRSPGGGCRLLEAVDDLIALNLSRPADRELLPALFATEFDPDDDAAIGLRCRTFRATELERCGRELGLAIAASYGHSPDDHLFPQRPKPRRGARGRFPRVLDLSALWAGPLAAHLLQLAGGDVIKVESRSRPDAMRWGEPAFFALLNQRKASVTLDLTCEDGLEQLRALIRRADIVIEAARPRALAQLGIDAAALIAESPNLVWITISGHGIEGDAANWVGFGDDCGVAAGLTAALQEASGAIGFVGDAIADPLTGIFAAREAWRGWSNGEGGRYPIAMSGVVRAARDQAGSGLDAALGSWGAAIGNRFPPVALRSSRPPHALGADNDDVARRWAC